MPLNKSERIKKGFVGKKKYTNKKGESWEIDFESEDVSVLTKEESKKLGIGIPNPTGKNFSYTYDKDGNILTIKEVIEKNNEEEK